MDSLISSNLLTQKISKKLQFGKGNITSDHIEHISKILANEDSIKQTTILNAQEKHLLHLFSQPYIDLKKNEGESELAIYILRKVVKKDIEINFLQKLIEGIDLFQKKPELLKKKKTNKKILNSLNIEHYSKHQTLFNIGDRGDLYYIVLTGSINVLINDPNKVNKNTDTPTTTTSNNNLDSSKPKTPPSQQDTKKNYNNNDDGNDSDFSTVEDEGFNTNLNTEREIPLDQQDQKKKPGFARSLSMLLKGEFKSQDNDQDFLQKNFPNMICVKTYAPGESFGEIALLTNSKRTATCVAQEDSYLMTLSKQAFDEIMGLYSQQMIEENVGFLKTFSFLRDLPPRKLLSLWHLFKERNLKPRQTLYSENDQVRHLHFVRSGEIELSKLQQVVKEDVKEHEKIKKTRIDQKIHNGLNTISKQKEKKSNYKRQPIVILGPNSYFGQEEILNKHKTRHSQAMALTESTVYTIEKNKLVQILRYYHQLKFFVEDIKIRSNWHSERVKNMKEAQKTQIQITTSLSAKKSKHQLLQSQIYNSLLLQQEKQSHQSSLQQQQQQQLQQNQSENEQYNSKIEKKLQTKQFILQKYRKSSQQFQQQSQDNNNNDLFESDILDLFNSNTKTNNNNEIQDFQNVVSSFSLNNNNIFNKPKSQTFDKSLPSYQLFSRKSQQFSGLDSLLQQGQKDQEERKNSQQLLQQQQQQQIQQETPTLIKIKKKGPKISDLKALLQENQQENQKDKYLNTIHTEPEEQLQQYQPQKQQIDQDTSILVPSSQQNQLQQQKLSQSTQNFQITKKFSAIQLHPLSQKHTPQLAQKKSQKEFKTAQQKHIDFQYLQDQQQLDTNRNPNNNMMSSSANFKKHLINNKKQINLTELASQVTIPKKFNSTTTKNNTNNNNNSQQNTLMLTNNYNQELDNLDPLLLNPKPRGYSTSNIKQKKSEIQKMKTYQQNIQQTIFQKQQKQQQYNLQQQQNYNFKSQNPSLNNLEPLDSNRNFPRSLSYLTLDPIQPSSQAQNALNTLNTQNNVSNTTKPISKKSLKQSHITIIKKNTEKKKKIIFKQNKENQENNFYSQKIQQQQQFQLKSQASESQKMYQQNIFSQSISQNNKLNNYKSLQNNYQPNMQRKLNSISEFQFNTLKPRQI